jgi:phosphopantetheinyl transferase
LLDLTQAAPKTKDRSQPLLNTLPYLKLEQAEIGMLSTILHGHNRIADRAPIEHSYVPIGESALQSTLDEQPGEQSPAVFDDMLWQHFDIMQEFLEQQEHILNADFEADAPAEDDWPFIQRLLEQNENRAVAEFDLDVSLHTFIQDHILYASELSDLDPDLHALPVVPLTASLEMLAEIAALLSTQPCVSALENVRAYNWIALDAGEKTVRLVADRVTGDGSAERIHAAIFDADNLLLEGDVLFGAEAHGEQPLLAPLASPRESSWRDDELYTAGMFHGPMFHSVKHIDAWDDSGIDVELADTPVCGFFGPRSQPLFFLNPVMLDAVGHLTAFWIAQSRGTDFSSFPSQIRRIELVNPFEQATEGYRMRGRMAFLDNDGRQGRFLEGDYDCIDLQGRAIIRILGWRDRFFDVPHSFYFGRTHPREGWYGEDWSSIYPDLPQDMLVWYVPPFPPGFLEDAGAVWKRLLVYTLLSREERDVWQSLPINPRRRSEWLMGRIALKEAARNWIAQHHGILLYPADINIRTDEAGKPYVAADGLEALGEPPQVSLSHADGYNVAVAGPADKPVGIDLETFGRIKLTDFIGGAFTSKEKAHVESAPENGREEVALRLWCAKEAAAKSLGTGLNGRPTLFEVSELSTDGMMAVVHSPEHLIPVSIQRKGEAIICIATMY